MILITSRLFRCDQSELNKGPSMVAMSELPSCIGGCGEPRSSGCNGDYQGSWINCELQSAMVGPDRVVVVRPGKLLIVSYGQLWWAKRCNVSRELPWRYEEWPWWAQGGPAVPNMAVVSSPRQPELAMATPGSQQSSQPYQWHSGFTTTDPP